jgi:penicillin-insensitive murein endopeptidase
MSGSVGVPHNGVLTAGVELPVKGEGFVRYRPKGAHYWGNPRLVALVTEAAKRVKDELPDGAPVLVGDISARHGGQIPGHRSHRTGRDVDLVYYAATPSGAPIPSPGFVRYGSDGLAQVKDERYVRLDVERQWLLVKALLTSDKAQVQWLFVSRHVEALLIDYARAKGEDLQLVWRAETMLLEPADSSPHDDHLHLRIACSAEEELTGCEGGGPRWEWLAPEPALRGVNLADIARDDPFGLEEEGDDA